MSAPSTVHFPSFMLKLYGELYEPAAGSPDRKGAAVIISHPLTAVKEQTSTDYAKMLSMDGFWALTFDAGYQGESTGEPRGLEDPHQRVEDNKAAVSFLTTLKGQVDPQRIGMLGICASGGYCSAAAQADVRVKALATVSASCVGVMTRNGGLSKEDSVENDSAIATTLRTATAWRTRAANEGVPDAPKLFSSDAVHLPLGVHSFFKGAATAYYDAKRGHHDRSDQKVPPQSHDLMLQFDSFRFQHLISPRPLLMIAGSEAETLHFSETAIDRAKEPKELFVVQGRNHFDLYDDHDKAGPMLVYFFGKHLGEV